MNNSNSLPKAQETISEGDRKLLERYRVQLLPIDEVFQSPENDHIYGPVDDNDSGMRMLINSIQRIGLEEPLVITQDRFILSGHRRHYALSCLGYSRIPVRFADVTREDSTDYHRLLTQYNPQRVKSIASVVREITMNSSDDDTDEIWTDYVEAKTEINADTMEVCGCKSVPPISPRKRDFLTKVKKIVQELKPYWPLSLRQVHYQMLNDPPLTDLSKPNSWYRLDASSYNKLKGLCRAARYQGEIPFHSLDDETRSTQLPKAGFSSIPQFINQELEWFLRGFNRCRMEGQFNHVEVLLEKSTLAPVTKDICERLGVPMTAARGYGGPSVWRHIELRFLEHVERTGNEDAKCIVIILSDHDPEGLDLADDALKSLRDMHGVPVEAIRPLVTLEQVKELGLPSNEAKPSSMRFQGYVERTGTTETWECEALPTDYLRRVLQETILSVVDVDQMNAVQEREAEEKSQIAKIRCELIGGMKP